MELIRALILKNFKKRFLKNFKDKLTDKKLIKYIKFAKNDNFLFPNDFENLKDSQVVVKHQF